MCIQGYADTCGNIFLSSGKNPGIWVVAYLVVGKACLVSNNQEKLLAKWHV